jgi:hypothetical protein
MEALRQPVRSPASAFRKRVRSRSRWISARGSQASHSESKSRANSSASQRASSRSVFGCRRRPRSALARPGSTRCTSKPCCSSSRATQRQPVVASITTAASLSFHSIAQSLSRSRDGSNRLSLSSPESGSSTTA